MNVPYANKSSDKNLDSHRYSVFAGWLIDGSGSPRQKDVIIDVSDGLIERVRRKKERSNADNRNSIDYSDSTLIPGLLDCHAHLSMSGTNDPMTREKERTAPFKEKRFLIERHINMYLSHGVIGVRDAGDNNGHTLQYKKETIARNDIMPLIINSPGRAWHSSGRYGAFIGRAPDKEKGLGKSIIDYFEYSDHIKIINSGLNSLKSYGKEIYPQFGDNELLDAISKVKKIGIKTMIHANGAEAIRSSIDAGCDSIEHGFFMGTENMMKMAEKGIVWVPTIFTMKALSGMFTPGSIEYETAGRYLNHQLDQIIKALDLGVIIAIGTDSGSPGVLHGESIFEEMRLFYLAGLSIEKIIQCATENGAPLFGLENKIGKISPGYAANFVVINESPENIFNRKILPKAVIINGLAHSPEVK